MPATQVVLATHAVAGSLSWSQVPGAQFACGLVPPAQYWPAVHAEHVAREVAVPAAFCTVPAAQVP